MPSNALVLNGQISLLPLRASLAAAGKMFVVTTAVNTPIAYAQVTGYSATANGLWSLSNSNPTGGANLYVDRLRMMETAAVATGTQLRWEIYSQTTIMALGTAAAAITPVNANAAYSGQTGAVATFFNAGAGTVPASAGVRTLIDEGSMAVGVNVVKDSYNWDFFSDAIPAGKTGLTAARATDTADIWAPAGPVIVPPGCSAYMNLWGPGTSTPSYEFKFSYFEF